MSNFSINVKIDSKSLMAFVMLIASIFLFFNTREVRAVSSNSLSGTFGCLQNKNFGGFVKAKTGGSQSINNILMLTFTEGSNVVAVRGVENKVLDFEGVNPRTVTAIFDEAGFSVNYSATKISNLYKLSDGTDSENGNSYFAVANSGNTLLMMGAPTTTSTDNAVCQKI
jgi:hypothetical protein